MLSSWVTPTQPQSQAPCPSRGNVTVSRGFADGLGQHSVPTASRLGIAHRLTRRRVPLVGLPHFPGPCRPDGVRFEDSGRHAAPSTRLQLKFDPRGVIHRAASRDSNEHSSHASGGEYAPRVLVVEHDRTLELVRPDVRVDLVVSIRPWPRSAHTPSRGRAAARAPRPRCRAVPQWGFSAGGPISFP